MELCRKNCRILPNRFEENLNQLFDDMLNHTDKLEYDINEIVSKLKQCLK